MIGARLTLPDASGELAALLFSEEPSRIIASTATAHVAEVKRRAAEEGVPVTDLGTTARADFVLTARQTEVRASLAELRDARERCLVPIVGE
jgi:phosphoribosylformylglycinamidine (FGAM) synthase-like enzyme